MNIVENPEVCDHIATTSRPFVVELTIDDHLGLADGIVRCRYCQRLYLLEMLDWAEGDRLFRISPLAKDHARGLIQDLTRGSCDLQRAGAEVAQLKSASAFAPYLVLMDAGKQQIRSVVPLPAEQTLPTRGWRELPCDGSWVTYARQHQASESVRSNTPIEYE